MGDTHSKLIQVLELMLKQHPPRLFGTCDHLTDTLERHGVDAPALMEVLRRRREVIFEDRKRMEEALGRPDPPLQGWVNP